MRTHGPQVAIPALLALALLLTACSGPSAGSPAPDLSPAGTPTPISALTITVSDGSGGTTTWRLTCDPTGGDHPNPVAACQALDQAADTALPAVPGDIACAEVFGGPETATITGTWQGQRVNSQLARNNSCETARWEALAAVLQP